MSYPSNSGDGIAADSAQTVAAGQLRAFVERIERLHEERSALSDDIKEVFADGRPWKPLCGARLRGSKAVTGHFLDGVEHRAFPKARP